MERWASYSPLMRCRLPGPQEAGAGREGAGDLGLGAGREGGGLLVPDLDPVDSVRSADRVHDGVQAVADDPVHPPHARAHEDVDELLRHVLLAHGVAPFPVRLFRVRLPSTHVPPGYASQTAAAVRSSA